MKLVNAIREGFTKALEYYNKPESFIKGEGFENFVREQVFTIDHYEITSKTHDYNTNKNDYITQSLRPDYELSERKTKKKFFLEVKYKTKEYNKIYLCRPDQLQRYKTFENCFIILGTGGEYYNPNALYLIPTNKIMYSELYLSYLKRYEITNIPILPNYITKQLM